MFQINLNTDVLNRLRDKVNEQTNISYNKEFEKKHRGRLLKTYRAWDTICAIMDRLDDTVFFLNELKLNTGKYNRSAFDFFDFMNNASVVIECIRELAGIFGGVSLDNFKNSTDIFNQTGKDGKGTDDLYFNYLRSLCSVHPVETSRHERYQSNDFECCPFVIWNNNGLKGDCDLSAMVYTNKDDEPSKNVLIYISQIFNYVKTRFDFVTEITNAIDEYQKEVISNFRNRKIKKEFENYIDYLRNLDKEMKERNGLDSSYSFDFLINLFELKLSNPINEIKMNLYKNALKYAVEFEHNRLQYMSFEGYDNTGLVYPERNIETSLYIELDSPRSGSEELRSYSYSLGKIGDLNYDSGDANKQWAYKQLDEMQMFLQRLVSFEDADGDFEHYALVQLALYLDCLENNCLINRNIPNDLEYRTRLLSDEEEKELLFNKADTL